jgi:hypothetical protein
MVNVEMWSKLLVIKLLASAAHFSPFPRLLEPGRNLDDDAQIASSSKVDARSRPAHK